MTRAIGAALALVNLATAIVGTQWPFRYALSKFALGRHWHRVDWSWLPRRWDGALTFDRDYAINLMMLIPLGVGYALWRRASWRRMLVEAAAIGIATGLALEAAQLLTEWRVTQLADVWRNAAGCFLGAAISCSLSQQLRVQPAHPDRSSLP